MLQKNIIALFFVNKPVNRVQNIPTVPTIEKCTDFITNSLCIFPFSEDELYSLLNKQNEKQKWARNDHVSSFPIKRVLNLIPLLFC